VQERDVSDLTSLFRRPHSNLIPFFTDGNRQLLQAPYHCHTRFFTQGAATQPTTGAQAHIARLTRMASSGVMSSSPKPSTGQRSHPEFHNCAQQLASRSMDLQARPQLSNRHNLPSLAWMASL